MSKVEKLQELIRMCQRFNQFDGKMQVSTILTLLEIAKADLMKKEIAPQDLEKLTGLLSGTMTRNVYYWADGHQDVTGGHLMVNVRIHPTDRRRRILSLTPKGRAFIDSVLASSEDKRNGPTEGDQMAS